MWSDRLCTTNLMHLIQYFMSAIIFMEFWGFQQFNPLQQCTCKLIKKQRILQTFLTFFWQYASTIHDPKKLMPFEPGLLHGSMAWRFLIIGHWSITSCITNSTCQLDGLRFPPLQVSETIFLLGRFELCIFYEDLKKPCWTIVNCQKFRPMEILIC